MTPASATKPTGPAETIDPDVEVPYAPSMVSREQACEEDRSGYAAAVDLGPIKVWSPTSWMPSPRRTIKINTALLLPSVFMYRLLLSIRAELRRDKSSARN